MNLTSALREEVTLLEDNQDASKTTTRMYNEVLKTRASISRIGTENGNELLDVIILKPPIKFKQTPFSALRWNNGDYKYKGTFKEHKEKYLKGVVARVS
ncbi:MAG: hypothetical protein LBM19_01705 [Holosporales bacterium]|jgi:hypothetical protein|nr:hypothetical protein [Holosporales bacterium]